LVNIKINKKLLQHVSDHKGSIIRELLYSAWLKLQ